LQQFIIKNKSNQNNSFNRQDLGSACVLKFFINNVKKFEKVLALIIFICYNAVLVIYAVLFVPSIVQNNDYGLRG
jgi:hypothetical protein